MCTRATDISRMGWVNETAPPVNALTQALTASMLLSASKSQVLDPCHENLRCKGSHPIAVVNHPSAESDMKSTHNTFFQCKGGMT